MLIHPTLDQMHQLGLAGMARALPSWRPTRRAPSCPTPNGSACCSIAKPPSAMSGDCEGRLRYARLRHQAARISRCGTE